MITAKGDLRRRPQRPLRERRGRRGRRPRGRRRVLRPVDRVRRRLPRDRRPRHRHDQRHRRRRRGHRRHASSRASAAPSTTSSRSRRPALQRPAGRRPRLQRRDARRAATSIITETDGFTAVREGGPARDRLATTSASPPLRPARVYVTVSAARSPQEEAARHAEPATPSGSAPARRGRLRRRRSTSSSATSTSTRDTLSDVPQRAVVLTFTAGATGTVDQTVYVYAVDDLRSEGDRVVAISHSVISDRHALRRHARPQRRGHGARQRHAGRLRHPGGSRATYDRGQPHDRRSRATTTTRLTDELLVHLAAAPVPQGTARSRPSSSTSLLDADSEAMRHDLVARSAATTRSRGTITFTSATGDWDNPSGS